MTYAINTFLVVAGFGLGVAVLVLAIGAAVISLDRIEKWWKS